MAALVFSVFYFCWCLSFLTFSAGYNWKWHVKVLFREKKHGKQRGGIETAAYRFLFFLWVFPLSKAKNVFSAFQWKYFPRTFKINTWLKTTVSSELTWTHQTDSPWMKRGSGPELCSVWGSCSLCGTIQGRLEMPSPALCIVSDIENRPSVRMDNAGPF